MKKFAFIFLIVMVLGFAALANANLTNNGNHLIYDVDLNITWYDVAISDMPWDEAMRWAFSLNYGNISGWQLPSVLEMAHLFYRELGNTIDDDSLNMGPFTNLFDWYWSREEYPNDLIGIELAGDFSFTWGYADVWPKSTHERILAVHEGNVTVPEPTTMLLLGLGLVGLAGVKRKFNK